MRKHLLFLRGYCREQSGVTAIEFAVIAPVLLTFVLGIIEVGMIFFTTMLIEGAITNSSRLGKTGFVAEGVSREQTILDLLEERTAGLVNMDNVSITTTAYPGFDDIGDAEPYQDANANGSYDPGETYDDINGNGQHDADMGEAGLGDANDVVVYTISYPWPIMTPMMSSIFGTSSYVITSRTVVKNEPYGTQISN